MSEAKAKQEVLDKKEVQTLRNLLAKIEAECEKLPDDVVAKAKEIHAFCKKHVPEDGKEWKFPLGSRTVEIQYIPERGEDWQKNYISLFHIVINYEFTWFARWWPVYHNDTERSETAQINWSYEFGRQSGRTKSLA